MNRSRTEVAESLALAVRVFVRRSHREGTPTKITDMVIQEVAESRSISGADYSMRTVWRIIRRDCALMGESHFIAR